MSATLLERLSARPERFPGALLLHGASEGPLERTSLHLAAFLLCAGEDPERRCDSCRRAMRGLHPDLLSLEPEGVQIRVDRVREAIAFGAGRPYESARRVVRVSRAELLGVEAANALLKTLEEPGSRLHWILATRHPERLLPTVRSRCLSLRVSSESPVERARAWQASGLTEEDAEDLAVLAPDSGPDGVERLEEARRFRSDVIEALRVGIVDRKLAALVLLAESVARADENELRIFGELLADAALLAAGVSSELVTHRAVTGGLSAIARSVDAGSLAKAATVAADYPPDTRRGNRRLHFENVLLELVISHQSSPARRKSD